MLLEAVNFAASYLASPRRNAGEINASVKLWARAGRCRQAWAGHEENSKRFIVEKLERVQGRRICAVLGSGLLRDVPIAALSAAFDEVWLYDLQHLASVRLWARLKGYGNLRFLNRDLSGLEDLARDPAEIVRPLDFLEDISGLDMVISANLLSQIGVGAGRMLAGWDLKPPEDSIPRLIQAHLDGLAGLAAPTCLITDIDYEIRARDGRILERHDLLHGVTPPQAAAEWSWTVVPLGELSPDYQAVHRVIAV